MNNIDKNGTAIFFFIIILLAIIFGGYYILKNKDKFVSNENSYTNEYIKEKTKKKDNSKDYIYYKDEDIVSEEDEIIYKNIVLNFESEDAKKIEDKLNKKMKEFKDNKEEVLSIDYEYNITNKYISLTANYYHFEDEEKETDKLEYYVFDIYSAKLLDNEDILKKENIKEKDIKDKINKYISKDNNIDKDKTLNNGYTLSINKNGKIIINFIVNLDNINYNVSIEMD